MDSFYTQEELSMLGFESSGKDVFISKKASIYNAKNISIGNNVRIDDFVILSGHISIGNFVHISAGSVLMCKEEGIHIEDFSCVSIGSKILGSSDDFSGQALVGPCIPLKYRCVSSQPIRLEKYSLLGCNSVVLPGGGLAEGVSVGASSLILRPTKPWGIYFGIPAKRIAQRSKKLLELEKEFLKDFSSKKTSNGGGGLNNLFDNCLEDYPYLNNPYYSDLISQRLSI